MSASESRLTKLYKGLTAKERAIMLLRWFKEDAEAPPELRQTTPWEQYEEIADLMSIGDATHHEVSWYALWLGARLDAVNVRLGMVLCLQLWSLHADQVRTHLVCDAGEPVTRSEYDARLAAARGEPVPIDVLAELLAEADAYEQDLDDRQYEERLRVHERELRRLVAKGTLPHTGRGRRLKVPLGAIYDWRAEETPLVPEYGLRYEVFPDEAAEPVQRLRGQREAIHGLVEGVPCLFPLDAKGEAGSKVDALGRNLVRLVAGELTAAWAELLAIERIVKDVSDRFGGEDPLHPEARRLLEDSKVVAAGVRKGLKPWFDDLVLPDEPDERVVAALTRIIEQESR